MDTTKKIKDKGYLRDVLLTLVSYCSNELALNNADIGRVFRRDRADIKRLIDKSKAKATT